VRESIGIQPSAGSLRRYGEFVFLPKRPGNRHTHLDSFLHIVSTSEEKRRKGKHSYIIHAQEIENQDIIITSGCRRKFKRAFYPRVCGTTSDAGDRLDKYLKKKKRYLIFFSYFSFIRNIAIHCCCTVAVMSLE
jgi:hypothetical protein